MKKIQGLQAPQGATSHSLKVKGEVQMKKGLWWITRYPETRKGIVSDEMLRGVENKHRYEDS